MTNLFVSKNNPLKVVVAEDDFLIADLLEDVLVDAGYDVCGLASTVDEAVELCEQHHPDLAVIDMRLAAGGLGTEIVKKLGNDVEIGVLYATGNANHVVLSATDGEACITKPYLPTDLLRALQIVFEITHKGTASGPFPRNFQLLRHTDSNRALEDVRHGNGT